jgi:hypothetical protein
MRDREEFRGGNCSATEHLVREIPLCPSFPRLLAALSRFEAHASAISLKTLTLCTARFVQHQSRHYKGGFEMKTRLRILSLSLLFMSVAMAYGQNEPKLPDPKIRTFEGELAKVDSVAKTITVKDADEKEKVFAYNELTQVVGADDGVQGLTGKTGVALKVSYREDGSTNVATKIEIQPKIARR